MKALTVRQPWARMIATGYKLVENRSRMTTYRGPLAVHAGAGWSERGADDTRVLQHARRDPTLIVGTIHRLHTGTRVPTVDITSPGMVFSAVLALAELVDCHPDAGCCRPWGESTYQTPTGRVSVVHHLVLEGVQALTVPLRINGRLGLWNLPGDVEQEIRDYHL